VCIIASVPGPNGPILIKNRDRNYDVDLKLAEVRGSLVLLDTLTYWLEGCNDQGLAIVNSALMVGRDEKEKKKSKSGKKSKDGIRILRALLQEDIQSALDSLLTYDQGIKGHTFIATGDRLWCLETTSKHRPILTELDPTVLHVRTNHGIYHPDAGYMKGEDRKSSLIREKTAQIVLSECRTPEEVLQAINRRFLEEDSPFNMVRATEKMRTSSQLVMEPGTHSVYINVIDAYTESFKNSCGEGSPFRVTVTRDLSPEPPRDPRLGK